MTVEIAATPNQKWVVRTPVADYNGVTNHVIFRSGVAVVEDEETARMLQEDFHYSVDPFIPPPAKLAPNDPDRAPRPQHPYEDARVAPFYPREATLPPGADEFAAIPAQSRIVHDAEVETAPKVNEDGEVQDEADE